MQTFLTYLGYFVIYWGIGIAAFGECWLEATKRTEIECRNRYDFQITNFDRFFSFTICTLGWPFFLMAAILSTFTRPPTNPQS